MALPFKCNSDVFSKIYQDEYKNRITHEYIRNQLGLSERVRLKLNGTFERELYLLDENDCIYKVIYRIQTAVWLDPVTEKWRYVSIFPNFIKRYCRPCLNMLEYIGCQLKRGDNFFSHISDPNEILDCEDRIVNPIRRIEKDCLKFKYDALLNSKYTAIYNISLCATCKQECALRKFSVLYSLIDIGRKFFGLQQHILSLINAVIVL